MFYSLIRNFTYKTETDVYIVDILKNEKDTKLPFKATIKKVDDNAKYVDVASWYLYGPNLVSDLDESIKSWIYWKEESERATEEIRRNHCRSTEDRLVDTKINMSFFAKKMNACEKYGTWTLAFLEDGSVMHLFLSSDKK